MKKIFFLILIFGLQFVLAQTGPRAQQLYSTAPDFYYDYLNFKSQVPGKTQVDMYIQVPYSNIQFIKKDNKFIANYSVDLTVYDEEKDNVIQKKVWDESITATTFNQTTSHNNYNLSLKTFQLPPGEYVVQAVVDDLNSNTDVNSETKLKVLSFDKPISLSDVLLIQGYKETNSGKKIIPNISQTVQIEDSTVQFYYEIYSDTSENVNLAYTIKDENRNTDYSQTFKKTLQKGKNEVYAKIHYPKFTFGKYELYVQVDDSTGDVIQSAGKQFKSVVLGIPSSITDLDKAVEEMIYIASSDQIDHIDSAKTFEEKLKRFMAFWKSRDKNSSTAANKVMYEYYRRVAYANKHFNAFHQDGWKTDMGMVYITLGPPDNVERHPFEIDSKPYEVWDYYNINRRFVFVDNTGFGDYRLINRDFPQWNRNSY